MFDANLNLPILTNIQILPDNRFVCTVKNNDEPLVLEKDDIFILEGNTFKMISDTEFIQIA